jgi:hypothetical protein
MLLTVQQFVDKYEIVLDGLLVKLPKITLSQRNQAVQEFEDQGSVGIAFGDCHEINIFVLDMAEGCGAQGEDGAPHLRVRNDLNAEDICKPWSTVATKGAEDEVLAFLIEDKDAAQHDEVRDFSKSTSERSVPMV